MRNEIFFIQVIFDDAGIFSREFVTEHENRVFQDMKVVLVREYGRPLCG